MRGQCAKDWMKRRMNDMPDNKDSLVIDYVQIKLVYNLIESVQNVIKPTQLGANWAQNEAVFGQEKSPFSDPKVGLGDGTASGSIYEAQSPRLCQAVVPSD